MPYLFKLQMCILQNCIVSWEGLMFLSSAGVPPQALLKPASVYQLTNLLFPLVGGIWQWQPAAVQGNKDSLELPP